MDGFDIYMSDPGYVRLKLYEEEELSKIQHRPLSQVSPHSKVVPIELSTSQCLVAYGKILHKLRKLKQLDAYRVKMIHRIANIIVADKAAEDSLQSKTENLMLMFQELGPSFFNIPVMDLKIKRPDSFASKGLLPATGDRPKKTSSNNSKSSSGLASDKSCTCDVSCFTLTELQRRLENFANAELNLRDLIQRQRKDNTKPAAPVSVISSASITPTPRQSSSRGKSRQTNNRDRDESLVGIDVDTSKSCAPDQDQHEASLNANNTMGQNVAPNTKLSDSLNELSAILEKKSSMEMIGSLDNVADVLFGKGIVDVRMMMNIESAVKLELTQEGCSSDVGDLLQLLLTDHHNANLVPEHADGVGDMASSDIGREHERQKLEALFASEFQRAKERSSAQLEMLLNDASFRSLQSRWGVLAGPGSQHIVGTLTARNMPISSNSTTFGAPPRYQNSGAVGKARNHQPSMTGLPQPPSEHTRGAKSTSLDTREHIQHLQSPTIDTTGISSSSSAEQLCARDIDNLRKVREKHRALLLRSVMACKMMCPYDIVITGSS